MDEENLFTWTGVIGFAIAVIALLFSLSGSVQYYFNETQFLTNETNVSINESWLSSFANVTNINNTYINETANLTGYWLSNGSSTASGNWDIGAYTFNSKNIYYDALKNNYLGDSATPSLTTGHDNFLVNGAGAKITTGYDNVGIGDADTLKEMTTANRNIAIGAGALGGVTTSYTQNIGVGTNAGRYYATSINTKPARSIYFGHYTQASGSIPTNENVFGYSAIGKGSNTFTFGQQSSTTTKYYMFGDWINLKDNKYIILGAGEDFKIGYDGTNAIFNTSAVGSGIAYFSNNVSATGYITRTTIYDKKRGDALDWVKDSSQLTDAKGIDHTQFYGYTKYNVTDYSKPIIEEVCKETTDEKGLLIIKCENETTYLKKEEEGILLDEEIAMLAQSVYELKKQNEFLQEQINNLTGKDVKLSEANTRQDEALCSIKLFNWCIKK